MTTKQRVGGETMPAPGELDAFLYDGLNEADLNRFTQLAEQFRSIVGHTSSGLRGLAQTLNNPSLDSVVKDMMGLIQKAKDAKNKQ